MGTFQLARQEAPTMGCTIKDAIADFQRRNAVEGATSYVLNYPDGTSQTIASSDNPLLDEVVDPNNAPDIKAVSSARAGRR